MKSKKSAQPQANLPASGDKGIHQKELRLCNQAKKQIATRKGNVAVFLGAGASKAFGWPLTGELLPHILRGLIDKDLFDENRINTKKEDETDRKHLKKTLSSLCPGLKIQVNYLKKYGKQLPLVTSLLSMVDYSIATGQSVINGATIEELRQGKLLIERAIYEVIEHELVPAGHNYWPQRSPNYHAYKLSKWTDNVRKSSASVGYITSNYDLAIEQVWGVDNSTRKKIDKMGIDLGFPWLWASNGSELLIQRPVRPKRRLYKLHGSTNWLRCGLCDRIHINPRVDVAVYAFQKYVDYNNTCHCGHSKLEMQLVSPSFVRDIRSPNLISVWQASLDWLRSSNDWIIIGYSFPDEDLNIRSLFARALSSQQKNVQITVIQHGDDDKTRMRYETFFPNKNLKYLTVGLETFLEKI